LERVFNSTSLEEQQRIGTATGISLAATRENMTPEQIAEAEGFLNTLYGTGEARFAKGATAADLDGVGKAGEIRRERQVGEIEGLESAAGFRGGDFQDLSRQAAGISAAEHVLGADKVVGFADAHGISPEDVMFARGSNYELAINDRTMGAFGPLLTDGQLDVARPGATMSMSFDPYNGEVGRVDVRSGQSGTFDNTTHILDGYRVDARQGTEGGLSLFRFADLNDAGNLSGAAQFANIYSKAENEGSDQSFGDSVAQQASSYLSNIAGKSVSYLESDSTTGSMEAYAGYHGSFGLKFLGNGHTAEIGARGSISKSDVDSKQVTNSYDFWNDRARDVYDRTLGSKTFEGDHIERSAAYLSGIGELRQEAEGIREWVKSQDHEDDQSLAASKNSTESEVKKPDVPNYPAYPRGFRAH